MPLSAVHLFLALSWFSVLLVSTEATGSCPNSPVPCPPCVYPLPGRPGARGPPGPAGAVPEAELLQLKREVVVQVMCELRKGDTAIRPATSCREIHKCNSTSPSGKYWLVTRIGAVEVFCDMETDGGGWTVLMRRQDGSVDFYLNWTDYKSGFGNLEGEHWLGLENMHLLTNLSSDPPELRVDLADWEGNTAFAKYDQFSVGDEDSDYTLSVSGYQSASTAGDSLTITRSSGDGPHNGQKFSTPDRENDIWGGNCAIERHGPWWHRRCYDSLLTGKYFTSGGPRSVPPYGIIWHTWRGHTYSLHLADMKIRPRV